MASTKGSGPPSSESTPPGWRDRVDTQNPGRWSTDPTMNRDADALSTDRNNLPPSGPGPQNQPRTFSRGGKVTRVSGPPVGKEDGKVLVQKGEFVVRKAAVKKYGPELTAVNKGKARITVPAGKKK